MRIYLHRAIDIFIDTLKAFFWIVVFLSIFIPGSISFWAPNA